MTTTYNIKLELGYEGTDFVRKMDIKDVDATAAATETVRAKVKAVNASLEGGSAGGLDNFFRADDYDSTQNVGALNSINACTINREDVTTLI